MIAKSSEQLKKASDLVVVKSNALVNAKLKQKYTLQEARFILWSISNYSKSPKTEDGQLILSANDFAKLTETDPSNIYREGNKFAEKLLSKTLNIEEEGAWVVCNWFSSIAYKDGQFYIEVYDKLIPHIQYLNSHFTKYRLKYALTLSSQYAVRLYELLVQYAKLKKRTFLYSELREKLGIKANELKQFGHFKTKVLDISEREINAKTDIKISWEGIKSGRSYQKIEFTIDQNDRDEPVEENKKLYKYIYDHMAKISVSDSVTQKLIKEHGVDKVREKIEYLNYKLSMGSSIRLPGSYVVDAIVKDYDVSEMKGEVLNDDYTLDKQIREINLVVNEYENALRGHLAKLDEKVRIEYEQRYNEAMEKLNQLLARKNSKNS